MSKEEKIFVATSEKYPTLIGQEFDISKGAYILMRNGVVVAQDDSSYKLVSMVSHLKMDSNDEFQLANLFLVRDGLHFLQHLHCMGRGYGLITPELPLTFRDQSATEHQINCQFLIDTGSTISSIPQSMYPFPVNDIHVDVETSAGKQRQFLTKIQVMIDEHVYNVMACINQGSSCILGMDILKYYTLTIDGDKAGILVKNNLVPNLEEEFRIE